MNDGANSSELSTSTVDILVFQVGSTRYGADASQIVRVDRPDATTFTFAPLGPLEAGSRALVFLSGEGEQRLRVDAVHGVHSVPVHDLRRMPPTAGGPASLIGCWLDGEQPVVLIDLPKTRTSEVERR